MANKYDITMKQYNGTDYDTLYPETTSGQIVLSDEAKENLHISTSTNASLDNAIETITQDGGTYQIGDVLTTVRTNLGNKWRLCNGSQITKSDYPELSSIIPTQLENTKTNNDTGADSGNTVGLTYNNHTLYFYNANTAKVYSVAYPFTSQATESSASSLVSTGDDKIGTPVFFDNNIYLAIRPSLISTTSRPYYYYGASFDNLYRDRITGTSQGYIPSMFMVANNTLFQAIIAYPNSDYKPIIRVYKMNEPSSGTYIRFSELTRFYSNTNLQNATEVTQGFCAMAYVGERYIFASNYTTTQNAKVGQVLSFKLSDTTSSDVIYKSSNVINFVSMASNSKCAVICAQNGIFYTEDGETFQNVTPTGITLNSSLQIDIGENLGVIYDPTNNLAYVVTDGNFKKWIANSSFLFGSQYQMFLDETNNAVVFANRAGVVGVSYFNKMSLPEISLSDATYTYIKVKN